MAPANKLALKYKPESFSVIERKGSEVVVQSDMDGRQYRRNVTHTKLLPSSGWVDQAAANGEVNDEQQVKENELSTAATNPIGRPKRCALKPSTTASGSTDRPKRNIVKPVRYN